MLRDFIFEPAPIPGLFLIQPKISEDDRGFFLEDYNKKVFAQQGITVDFVQDNHSRSSQGVLRGLHFQKEPMAQDKLVRVVSGEVFDVAVDIRAGSPTFGRWFGVRLSAQNKQMFFLPRGFAHGFQVLSPTADFLYKVSNYYSPENEGGLSWNDPDIGIDWPISEPILSGRDQSHPRLKEL